MGISATQELLSRGADPTIRDSEGSSLLHIIARENYRTLLPLFMAVPSKEEEAVPLPAKPLDINVLDRAGQTPLGVALRHSSEPIIHAIIMCGGVVDGARYTTLKTELEATRKELGMKTAEVRRIYRRVQMAKEQCRQLIASKEEGYTILHTLTGHTSRVYAVAYAPDGRSIASASEDNTVYIWQKTIEALHKLLADLVLDEEAKTSTTHRFYRQGARHGA